MVQTVVSQRSKDRTESNPQRRRTAAAPALLTLVTVLAAILGGCGDEGNPRASALPESDPAVRLIVPAELGPGTFELFLDPRDPLDKELLVAPLSLKLQQAGRVLNVLIIGPNPVVRPPEERSVPAIRPGGVGPHQFLMPSLEAGDYQLCGVVTIERGDSEAQAELVRTCTDFKVIATTTTSAGG